MRVTFAAQMLAGLVAAVICADASASCAETEACFAVTGHVEHCSADKIDGRRVVRLELSDVVAAQAPCGFTPSSEAAPAEIERRIEHLAETRVRVQFREERFEERFQSHLQAFEF